MCEAPFHESALWFIANAGRKKTKLLPIIIKSVLLKQSICLKDIIIDWKGS